MLEERLCEYCARSYTPRVKERRYCSRQCASAHSRPSSIVIKTADPAVAVLVLPSGARALIDAVDADWVASYRWRLSPQGYVNRHSPSNHGAEASALHRAITQAPAGMDVDHISGDTLDNRRANLRVTTHAENMQNRRRANRNSQTGIRGVTLFRRTGRYSAQVHVQGRRHHLGYFATAEDAARAVARARAELMPCSTDARASTTPAA